MGNLGTRLLDRGKAAGALPREAKNYGYPLPAIPVRPALQFQPKG